MLWDEHIPETGCKTTCGGEIILTDLTDTRCLLYSCFKDIATLWQGPWNNSLKLTQKPWCWCMNFSSARILWSKKCQKTFSVFLQVPVFPGDGNSFCRLEKSEKTRRGRWGDCLNARLVKSIECIGSQDELLEQLMEHQLCQRCSGWQVAHGCRSVEVASPASCENQIVLQTSMCFCKMI